jgi:hypothetical protein
LFISFPPENKNILGKILQKNPGQKCPGLYSVILPPYDFPRLYMYPCPFLFLRHASYFPSLIQTLLSVLELHQISRRKAFHFLKAGRGLSPPVGNDEFVFVSPNPEEFSHLFNSY